MDHAPGPKSCARTPTRVRAVLLGPQRLRAIDAITRSYRLGPPGYLIALLGALISPALGVVLFIILAGLYLLPSSTGA